jgi:hypothetical protein
MPSTQPHAHTHAHTYIDIHTYIYIHACRDKSRPYHRWSYYLVNQTVGKQIGKTNRKASVARHRDGDKVREVSQDAEGGWWSKRSVQRMDGVNSEILRCMAWAWHLHVDDGGCMSTVVDIRHDERVFTLLPFSTALAHASHMHAQSRSRYVCYASRIEQMCPHPRSIIESPLLWPAPISLTRSFVRSQRRKSREEVWNAHACMWAHDAYADNGGIGRLYRYSPSPSRTPLSYAMHACMCVRMHMHVCVHMYVRMCACVCMYVCMYACMCACMYVRMHACICIDACVLWVKP